MPDSECLSRAAEPKTATAARTPQFQLRFVRAQLAMTVPSVMPELYTPPSPAEPSIACLSLVRSCDGTSLFRSVRTPPIADVRVHRQAPSW